MKDFMLLQDGEQPPPDDLAAVQAEARAKILEFNEWLLARHLSGACGIAIPNTDESVRTESAVGGDANSALIAIGALVSAAARTLASGTAGSDARAQQLQVVLRVVREALTALSNHPVTPP